MEVLDTAQAGVCRHPQREDIEREWVDWGNTSRISEEFRLSRDSIYRHAHALGLFEKRRRNVKRALERIIERSEGVEVTESAVVAAVQALSKINSNGQWVDRVEGVSLNELFDKMTTEELEAYAKTGSLPDWFTARVGATPIDSQEAETVIKAENNLVKGATPRPGDFPLGSPQSRAAARAFLANQQPAFVISICSNVHEGLPTSTLYRNHEGRLVILNREAV